MSKWGAVHVTIFSGRLLTQRSVGYTAGDKIKSNDGQLEDLAVPLCAARKLVPRPHSRLRSRWNSKRTRSKESGHKPDEQEGTEGVGLDYIMVFVVGGICWHTPYAAFWSHEPVHRAKPLHVYKSQLGITTSFTSLFLTCILIKVMKLGGEKWYITIVQSFFFVVLLQSPASSKNTVPSPHPSHEIDKYDIELSCCTMSIKPPEYCSQASNGAAEHSGTTRRPVK